MKNTYRRFENSKHGVLITEAWNHKTARKLHGFTFIRG
jgi:hypothetical protein